MTITSFNGYYRFLSNFFPSNVYLDGVLYSTVENAYQAAKTTNTAERRKFEGISPVLAKRFGRSLVLRPDWDIIKILVMQELLQQKFAPGTMLGDLLCQTDPEELIEGNTWGDTFWGICKGKGQNWLGRLLMEQREYLKCPVPF